MPFSFLFNVFEPVGLVFGPHLTYMIQSGMDDFYGTIYKKWIPGAHLGIYTPIGNRIQIMGQVRSDIPARFTGDGDSYSFVMNFREMRSEVNTSEFKSRMELICLC